MNIFDNEVVKKEINKLEKLIVLADDREAKEDIQVLREALVRLDEELINGNEPFAIIECNMWAECHSSLSIILEEFDLRIDPHGEVVEEHDVFVVRKHPTKREFSMEVEKIMTLSTSHIKDETANYLADESRGELVVYKKDQFGWFIFIGSDEPFNNVPFELLKVIEFAREHGCAWLCLDRDGQLNKDLPIHQW